MWVAIASLGLSMIQGAQASKEQNRLSAQNRDSAITSQTYENAGTNERLREEQEVAADRKLEMKKKALKATSTLQAQGRSVSGADGQSQEIMNELGLATQQLSSNISGKRRQTEMDKKGTTSRAQSRINSMPMKSFDPTAQLVTSGLSIYSGFKTDARALKASGGGKLEFTDWFWGKDI